MEFLYLILIKFLYFCFFCDLSLENFMIKYYEVKCIEVFLIIIVFIIVENVYIMYMKLLKKIKLMYICG